MNNQPIMSLQRLIISIFTLLLGFSLYSQQSLASACQGTTLTPLINSIICSDNQGKVLKKVQFSKNSSSLSPRTRAVLDQYIQELLKYPEIKLEVAIYTDNSGSKHWNSRLSNERAQTVRLYMIFKGLNASQLIAKGYGESQPISSNLTQKGRLQNRRLVLRLSDKPS